jgi:putative iron-regulated protein
LIVSLNEKEGKKNISTGFHAIEFLLWGQGVGETEPGNRSWRDYAPEARNGARRRQYLRIVCALLVEHLEAITTDWERGGADNYRRQFLKLDSNTAVGNILKGLGSLSGPELAGERLTVPYETKEKREEQDCFSDNTRADLIDAALGIQNVYLGRYTDYSGQTMQGASVHDLLAAVDPEFARKMARQVEWSVACARAIPESFGQAVQGKDSAPGRRAVRAALEAFQTQSELIAQAAKVLSIELNL